MLCCFVRGWWEWECAQFDCNGGERVDGLARAFQTKHKMETAIGTPQIFFSESLSMPPGLESPPNPSIDDRRRATNGCQGNQHGLTQPASAKNCTAPISLAFKAGRRQPPDKAAAFIPSHKGLETTLTTPTPRNQADGAGSRLRKINHKKKKKKKKKNPINLPFPVRSPQPTTDLEGGDVMRKKAVGTTEVTSRQPSSVGVCELAGQNKNSRRNGESQQSR